jgi:hypothetical protein
MKVWGKRERAEGERRIVLRSKGCLAEKLEILLGIEKRNTWKIHCNFSRESLEIP